MGVLTGVVSSATLQASSQDVSSHKALDEVVVVLFDACRDKIKSPLLDLRLLASSATSFPNFSVLTGSRNRLPLLVRCRLERNFCFHQHT